MFKDIEDALEIFSGKWQECETMDCKFRGNSETETVRLDKSTENNWCEEIVTRICEIFVNFEIKAVN